MDSNEPTESLYIAPGVTSLIIAVDTDKRSPGHLTYYPSDVETVALQIPFQYGEVPKHTVVHRGPCQAGNGSVLKESAGTSG